MFLVRSLLATALLLFAGAAKAQVGCVPNPNLTPSANTPPGYVNGCPMPAAAFNSFAPQTLAVGGALGAPYTVFGVTGTMSGILAASSTDPYATLVTPFAQIAVTSDAATNVGAGSGIPALGVYHKIGGTGAGGGARMGIWSDLVQDGNLPTNATPFQTGIFSNVWAKSGTNGGEYYGYAAQVIDDLGIVHYGTVGGEIDVALHASGAQIKEGWAVASAPITSGPDLYQGTNYSAGYGLWAGGSCGAGTLAGGSACAGFNIGLSFGRSDSYWPISSTGAIIAATQGIGTQANMKAGFGIDFSKVTFSNNMMNFGGKFVVNSLGNSAIATPYPARIWNDTNMTPTTGGYVRLAGTGNGAFQWQVNTAAAADFSSVNQGVTFNADGSITPPARTTSSLPACVAGIKGEMFEVPDQVALPAYGGSLGAGGGSVVVLAICDGVSAWKAH